MFKRIIGLFVLICLLFFLISCPPPEEEDCLTEEMEEYGYGVYFFVTFMAAFQAPGSEIVESGNITTITFTNMEYSDEGSTVNGTIVYNEGVDPPTENGDLTFSNDPAGLVTIETDMEIVDNSYTGTFTINDCNESSGEGYQVFLDEQLTK